MKKTIIILALLTLAAAGTARGQSTWSLRRCIDYAVEHNIEIHQQALNVENSEITLNTSENSRLPDLNASASQYFNFGRSPSMATGVYEENRSASTSANLSTSVPVFQGLRISNQIKSNRLDLKAATENLNKAKENLQLQVTSLYLEVLFKKEILKVYREQLALTETQVERTGVLVETGKVPMSQLFDIRAQAANDEVNVVGAQNDVAFSLLTLSQSLNLEDTEGFDVEEPDTGNFLVSEIGSVQNPDRIYETAVGIRPHVKEAEYLLESSRYDVRIAKARFWPTISLNASYNNGFSHKFGDVNQTIAEQLRGNQREAVGLNLSIPIFNRLATRNSVRSANLSVVNRSLELSNVKLALYKEIQQAHQSATAAQAKYAATLRSMEAAEEALKYAQERYEVGKATVYELNDAQTKLVTSRSEQVQSKYEFLFRTKILDFYQGIPIDIR